MTGAIRENCFARPTFYLFGAKCYNNQLFRLHRSS
jgi:hypothetical protein